MSFLDVPDLSSAGSKYITDPGEYLVKVTKVEKRDGANYPLYAWTLEVVSGPHAGKTITYKTTLAPQALFILRNFLEALGIPIPQSAFRIPLEKLMGRRCIIVCEEVPRKDDPTETYISVKKVKPVTATTPAVPQSTTPAMVDGNQFVDEEVPDRVGPLGI